MHQVTHHCLQGPWDLSTSVTISSWPVTVELIRNICRIEIKQRQWRQLICTRKVQLMWEVKNVESQTDTDQLHETDWLSEIYALLKWNYPSNANARLMKSLNCNIGKLTYWNLYTEVFIDMQSTIYPFTHYVSAPHVPLKNEPHYLHLILLLRALWKAKNGNLLNQSLCYTLWQASSFNYDSLLLPKWDVLWKNSVKGETKIFLFSHSPSTDPSVYDNTPQFGSVWINVIHQTEFKKFKWYNKFMVGREFGVFVQVHKYISENSAFLQLHPPTSPLEIKSF